MRQDIETANTLKTPHTMTLPTITPGPRHIEKQPNGRTFVVYSDGDTEIAECHTEADAKSVADLPELLDALEDLRQRMALVDKVKPAAPVTTFDGPEPETPTFHHTPNGIFLRMDEHALQALAIMARVYLEVIKQDMWDAFGVVGATHYLNASRELAEQISDAT